MQLSMFAMDAELPLIREDSYAYKVGTGDMFCLHTPSTGEVAVLAFLTEDEVLEEFSKVERGQPVGTPSKKDPSRMWRYEIQVHPEDEDYPEGYPHSMYFEEIQDGEGPVKGSRHP